MTNIQKIIEEFQTFVSFNDLYVRGYPVGKLESFLLSSLNQIRQETLDEVEVEIETYFGHIRNNGVDGKPINISNEIISEDIIKIIQSKKENI